MYSNISDPLPNKSDNPIKKIGKTSGDLDYTKNASVNTTDTFAKEGKTDMVDKKRRQNLML